MIILEHNEHHLGLHRFGWAYVVNAIKEHINYDHNLIFDTILDVTEIYHYRPWIGIIHHTFNKQFSNNCAELFSKRQFIRSLSVCKGLITLSNNLKDDIVEQLLKLRINVPVYCILHPTSFNVPRFRITNFKDKIVHIGAWYRNSFSFYALQVKYPKFLLHGPKMDYIVPKKNTTIQQSITQQQLPPINTQNNRYNRFCRPYTNATNYGTMAIPVNTSNGGFCNLQRNTFYDNMEKYVHSCLDSVTIIDQLNNNEYDQLLSESIVFLHLIDASAVNTVIECIVRNTPLIINRHPALEEYLGIDYPGFYTDLREAAYIINSKWRVIGIYIFLMNLDKTHIRIETFIKNLQHILESVSTQLHVNTNNDECPICTDTIESDHFITNCGHIYHMLCMERWLEQQNNCPVCRTHIF